VEWIVGIYLAIGLFKAFGTIGNPNPALKPIWMSTERNPLTWVMYFTLYVIFWPFPRR